MELKPLNIFYEEPNPDRWIKFDRYPRLLIRRIVRGKLRPGGQMMVAINLISGLRKINYPFRYNDYKYINKHPEEVACVIGKFHIIYQNKIKKNPIIFGASVFSHPLECPDLLTNFPNIKLVLVPGEWMRRMFQPYYGSNVISWPVGIDTEEWNYSKLNKNIDFLIYDKIRWNYDKYQQELIRPIKKLLNTNNLSIDYVRYGFYNPDELKQKIKLAKAVIFLCEHETQGLAYQQILSTNTPIFAWDRGGYWQDPQYFPDKVKFEPVCSVPYWNVHCGMKFKDFNEFENSLNLFITQQENGFFEPRDYIIKNLTLEIAATEFVKIVKELQL